jgi:hypothetical protein
MVSRAQLAYATTGALALAALALVAGGRSAAPAVKHSYAELGINRSRAPVDALVEAALADARRWLRDATWLSIAVDGVRADGTIDLSAAAGTPRVRVISPGRARSLSRHRRAAAILEYRFDGGGISAPAVAGVEKPWPARFPARRPRCGVAALARAARERGLGAAETLRLTFDLRIAGPSGARGAAWRVFSDRPAVSGYYSAADCSYIGS